MPLFLLGKTNFWERYAFSLLIDQSLRYLRELSPSTKKRSISSYVVSWLRFKTTGRQLSCRPNILSICCGIKSIIFRFSHLRTQWPFCEIKSLFKVLFYLHWFQGRRNYGSHHDVSIRSDQDAFAILCYAVPAQLHPCATRWKQRRHWILLGQQCWPAHALLHPWNELKFILSSSAVSHQYPIGCLPRICLARVVDGQFRHILSSST